MMILLDHYLAVRRAAGFKLIGTEFRLRAFTRYAMKLGETHIRAETAILWAGTASSRAESHKRLRTVAIFARHLRAEDPNHELPPSNLYRGQRSRRVPYIYRGEEIRSILEAAGRLGG